MSNSIAYPFTDRIMVLAHTFSASGRLGVQSGDGEIEILSRDPNGRLGDETVNTHV